MDQKTIDRQKPTTERQYFPDTEVKGLKFIIQPLPSGSTSWRYQREQWKDGERIKTHYWTTPGTLKLKEARQWALRLKSEPFPSKDKATTGLTVKDILDRRLEWMKARGARSVKDFEHSIEYLSTIHGKLLTELTKDDCHKVHAYITKHGKNGKKGASYPANKMMHHLKAAWKYARNFDDKKLVPEVCPATAVELNPEYERDAKFTEADLPSFAANVSALGNPIRQAFWWLLMFTGTRGEMLTQVETAWCEADRIVIPAHVMKVAKKKQRKNFVVPLSTPAREWVQKAIAAGDNSRWLFPSDTAASGHLEEWKEDTMPGWGPKETRKVYRTQLQKTPTSLMIARSLMDHGGVKDIERHYLTLADLFADRMKAQEAVATNILRLTGLANATSSAV